MTYLRGASSAGVNLVVVKGLFVLLPFFIENRLWIGMERSYIVLVDGGKPLGSSTERTMNCS